MAAQSSKMVETAAGGQGTTKAVSMFSNLISQSSNFVMAGVKNLVVKKHNLPLTKIVDEIMEQKQGKVMITGDDILIEYVERLMNEIKNVTDNDLKTSWKT